MDDQDASRRLFLIKSLTGVSAAWLALRMPEIVAAQEHAHKAVQSSAPVKFRSEDASRRLFLIKSLTGVSAAWLALRMPEIVAAQEHAHKAVQSSAPVKF